MITINIQYSNARPSEITINKLYVHDLLLFPEDSNIRKYKKIIIPSGIKRFDNLPIKITHQHIIRYIDDYVENNGLIKSTNRTLFMFTSLLTALVLGKKYAKLYDREDYIVFNNLSYIPKSDFIRKNGLLKGMDRYIISFNTLKGEFIDNMGESVHFNNFRHGNYVRIKDKPLSLTELKLLLDTYKRTKDANRESFHVELDMFFPDKDNSTPTPSASKSKDIYDKYEDKDADKYADKDDKLPI